MLSSSTSSSLFKDSLRAIARRKSGLVKSSLRAPINLPELLEKALQGIDGRGGGHPHACGAVIKEEDWEAFLQNIKEELK